MADESESVERRSSRKDTVQVPGTAFRVFAGVATAALVAVGGTMYRVALTVESSVGQLRNMKETSERRLARLERLIEMHQTEAQNWKFRIIEAENAIENCEQFMNRRVNGLDNG